MRATIFSCFDFVTGGKPTASFLEYRVTKINKPEAPKKKRAAQLNERLRDAKDKAKKS
jgi:hypothetical protein